MKEFVVYTLLRIGLFVATYLVIGGTWLAIAGKGQANLLWPFLVSVLVSAGLSLWLLRGPRERFAQRVQARAEAATAKFDEIRSKEDVD